MTLGPQIGGVFSEIVRNLGRTGIIEGGDSDVVVITKANYAPGNQQLHLDATSDGSYNSGVSLTASPGGVMEAKSDHYHLKYTLSGCPCMITVTSGKGGSDSVTVGP